MSTGEGSPAIWGDRIFLSEYDDDSGELRVVAVDRLSGSILWRKAVPSEEIERHHPSASPATATPAVDAERVYVYFGSHGLTAFDHEGNVAWDYPMPMARMREGSGVSPVIIGNRVILNRDERRRASIVALDASSGELVWRREHPTSSGGGGHATPMLWNGQLIVHRPGEAVALDLKTGERVWWVKMNTKAGGTPVATKKLLYVPAFNNWGEPDLIGNMVDFATALKRYDANSNGLIELAELPEDLHLSQRPEARNIRNGDLAWQARWPARSRDTNKDGSLNAEEWARLQSFGRLREHGLTAIEPGGQGNVSDSHVAWQETKAVPETGSPVVFDNRVYMVKNGGIVSCMNAERGELAYRKRLGATGTYYSSPIVIGGNIYVASGEGVIVVFKSGDQFEVLARNDLGEEIKATPAAADGVLYVRTAAHLYAFE